MFILPEKDEFDYVDIPIFCAPPVRREISKGTTLVYFDVTFLDNVSSNHIPIHALVFQNYYTAALSINQNSSSSTMTVLERKTLMENSCCEKDGNSWHIIYASEFNDYFIDRKTKRINLYQSTGLWNVFEIRNLKMVGLYKKNNVATVPTKSNSITKVSTFLKHDMKVLKSINI